MQHRYHRVLTIAGSDSGGGAGIQADLKTIAACGCYGTSAITAITAQNTQGVKDIHPIPGEMIRSQIEAVLEDIGTDSIKIGMLHSSEVIKTVSSTLSHYSLQKVVLDPVMVATSGDTLLKEDAIESLCQELFPLVRIITPNIPEAEVILERNIREEDDLASITRELSKKCNTSVLLKGGHLAGEKLVDHVFDHQNQELLSFPTQRIHTKNTHGTGCTLSSALAAYLAKGFGLIEAVGLAQTYLYAAIQKGANYELGEGHGPVHHLWKYWE